MAPTSGPASIAGDGRSRRPSRARALNVALDVPWSPAIRRSTGAIGRRHLTPSAAHRGRGRQIRSTIPTSFGGACRFENNLYVADFRTRVLINSFGTANLICTNAAITTKTDLRVSKTDGATSAVPGTTTTYTITVTNAGAVAANAVIHDAFPTAITGATWTAVGVGGASGFAASGSGTIADTASLPAGAKVTYTVIATIDPSATGTLSNTATVAAGPNTVDTNPANNSATDMDTLTPRADLAISKTDSKSTYTPGNPVTYTIVVGNSGPSNVTGATVADTIPAAITGVTWTSATAGVASVASGASGSGNSLAATVNITAGAGNTVTFTVTGTVSQSATGNLANTATITPPAGTTDATTGNNGAVDTDTILASPTLATTPNLTSVVLGTTSVTLTDSAVLVGRLQPDRHHHLHAGRTAAPPWTPRR